MVYFVDQEERKASDSTFYLEFQKGNYHGKCWLQDSLNIGGDLWDQYHLSELIRSVIAGFDYYGITVVTRDQWKAIVKTAQNANPTWAAIIAEATPWVDNCFTEYDEFTILGV